MTEAAQLGGQLMVAALDRMIRQADDLADDDDERKRRSRARVPEAPRTLRRILRMTHKSPRRPQR